MQVQRIGDVSAIRDAVEIPGLGALAVNAFVIHAEEPVLVDTGRPIVKDEFLAAVRSVIDPSTIRWVWLTHPDRDHMGALIDILELAPQARLVTSFMGFGYLGVEFQIALERAYLINPGQSLSIGGGRRLHAFRPPLFDSPMTAGFYDDATGTCFSSDCFGAPLAGLDEALAADIGGIDPAAVQAAQLTWAGADSPWVCHVDPVKFAASYDHFREFRPELVLSTHLPPVRGQLDELLAMLARAPEAPQFVGPDQAAIEAMLAGMVPPQAAPEPAPTV
jgi:hypothetical protein